MAEAEVEFLFIFLVVVACEEVAGQPGPGLFAACVFLPGFLWLLGTVLGGHVLMRHASSSGRSYR